MALLLAIETGRRSPVFAYGFALASFAVAVMVRLWADWGLPPGFPFLTFFPAVILTTFFAGLWPGVLVAVLSTLAAWYLFIPPDGFGLNGPGALALGFFVLIVVIDIAVIHVMNVSLTRVRLERARAQRAEQEASDLAAHRALLFTELQHRVSNNIQIVSALLALQKADVTDEKARRALSDAASRLATIGRIQRRLHDPGMAHSNFAGFLSELVEDVVRAGAPAGIDVQVTAPSLPLPPEKIIPAALIVAELVSNSLEHAFIGRHQGTIRVDARQAADSRIELSVSDDGNGLPPGFDAATVSSLGLRLVRLMTQQLGGHFSMDENGGRGAMARISFAAA
ncbi:sensor histidine kinase [Niveispirillum fermenti]|uniref:sensor histidine kinase n=1 Tax=Niveispirillum fermenti TaxID=1233113 RepID=UPI003A85AF47